MGLWEDAQAANEDAKRQADAAAVQTRDRQHAAGVSPLNESGWFRVLWPDEGPEETMNTWLVGNGIPRRRSCGNCAVRMSLPRKASRVRSSLPS